MSTKAFDLAMPVTASSPLTTVRRPFLGATLTLAFWLFNFSLMTLSTLMDGGEQWQARTAGRFVAMLAGLLFCYLIHLCLRAWRYRPFWKRIGLAFGLSLIAGDALSWVLGGASAAFTGTPMPSLADFSGRALYGIAYYVWFFLAWSAMYIALAYSEEVRQQERRWGELRALAQATQLRALTYQIRPHFLFNTLNSISSLVLDRRNDDAEVMIGRLSEFLRASLALDPMKSIRLEEEVALQRLYLEIEQIRFPDLDVRIDLPADLMDARVPSLILQPLVENSIKYAVAGHSEPAAISIAARLRGDMLEVVVEDTGAGISPEQSGSGIGLANVRNRLLEQFGEKQEFEAAPRHPRGFRVRMCFPLRFSA